MRKTIFRRVLLYEILLIVFVIGAVFSLSVPRISSQYILTFTRHLKESSSLLEPDILACLSRNDLQALDRLVKERAALAQIRITVIAADGKVLADSHENPASMENHADRPEVRQALASGTGTARRHSATIGEHMLYVASRVNVDSGLPVIIRTSCYLRDINTLMAALTRRIAGAGVAAALFAFCLALLPARTFSRQIRELTEHTRKVAAGDFSVRIAARTDDELGELAQNFAAMVGEIDRLFRDIEHQRGELAAIISFMREGLLVLDREGRISLANESMVRILGVSAVEGRPYWEALREPEFDSLVKAVSAEKPAHTGQVEISDRTYLCSLSRVPRGDVVAVFHDITERRALETLKKEFVVNVSHELRTPLTAISGYLETIEGETTGEVREHLAVVQRNVERLTRIVEDLLTLSQLEDRAAGLEMKPVDLAALAQRVAAIFQQRCAQKGLALKVETEPDLPQVLGDAFRLEQLLVNLLDNACKYTERGTVTVSLSSGNGYVSLAVADTGIGIPEADQQRVFERFYVVDKSRSRALGGTGLGLSIVKHIAALHNGTVSVSSRVGKGSVFTVALPAAPAHRQP